MYMHVHVHVRIRIPVASLECVLFECNGVTRKGTNMEAVHHK